MADWNKRVSDAYFLQKWLPQDLPIPEITQDGDDGDITLEWYASKDRVCVVWSRDGYVSWAGLFDGTSSHGSCKELALVPTECRELLAKVIGALPTKGES